MQKLLQHESFRIKMVVGSRLHHHSPSSLRGASWSEQHINSDVAVFEADKRRGNLPSLINWREIFKIHGCETTFLQSQSREIASGMQQRFATLMFNNSLTEPRNDELLWEWSELQIFQKGNVCVY